MKKRLSYLLALFCSPIASLCMSAEETNTKAKGTSFSNWKGLYFSGQLGAGWPQASCNYDNPNYFNTYGAEVLGNHFNFNTNGFVGGGAFGYNLQIRHLVIGLESGILYTDFQKKIASPFFPDIDRYSYEMNWLASAKARIGIAYRRFLPFFTAGWAGTPMSLTLQDIPSSISAHRSKWINGWTLGGGFDCKVVNPLSLGIAYDYFQFNLDSKSIPCSLCGSGIGFGTPIVSSNIHTQTVTARINLHF